MTKQRLENYISLSRELSLTQNAERIAEIKAELKAIENWIAAVPRSKTRRSFELHYIKGCSWLYTATLLEFQDEGAPRKLCNRYLKKFQKN